MMDNGMSYEQALAGLARVEEVSDGKLVAEITELPNGKYAIEVTGTDQESNQFLQWVGAEMDRRKARYN